MSVVGSDAWAKLPPDERQTAAQAAVALEMKWRRLTVVTFLFLDNMAFLSSEQVFRVQPELLARQ